MLSEVTRPDGYCVQFAYDALGRRLYKRFKQTTTHYVWDGNVPLHEYKSFDAREATADDIITWVFEQDSYAPMAKIKGDKKYSIVTDHLGTPIRGYTEEGDKIWERELDSFGNVRMGVGDEGFCNYLYQGQSYDRETGLAYNRFRYYDPEQGNYISQDPIGLAGGNPTLYGYVDDPTGWLDVFGLKGCEVMDSEGSDHDIILKLTKSTYNEAFGHGDDIMKKTGIDIMEIDRPGSKKRREDNLRNVPTKSGKDRDEWPMAMFKESVGADIRHIDPSDNRGAGSSIRAALKDYPDGTKVKFKIIED